MSIRTDEIEDLLRRLEANDQFIEERDTPGLNKDSLTYELVEEAKAKNKQITKRLHKLGHTVL